MLIHLIGNTLVASLQNILITRCLLDQSDKIPSTGPLQVERFAEMLSS